MVHISETWYFHSQIVFNLANPCLLFPYIIHVLQSINCYNYSIRETIDIPRFCGFKEVVCFSGKKSTSKVYSLPSFNYIIHHWCHFQRC